MKLTFLEARVPLTKSFTPTSKKPYPNAYEFTSHYEPCNGLAHMANLLKAHAKLGHCLLKGHLIKKLLNESRAGSTDPNLPTDFLCLDIDGMKGLQDVNTFMSILGLGNLSYVLQWSSSYGVNGDFDLRAHVYIELIQSVLPGVVKLWLKQMNLEKFNAHLRLTKTNVALHWGLDITTCQNDKLIYITPPECTPKSIDQFTGERISYIPKIESKLDFCKLAVATAEQLKLAEEDKINELRTQISLPARHKAKFKLKEFQGETYLPNPDVAAVSSLKTERGFTYINLNGGDSWGYWHPEENPTFIYNFKGEPTYRTSELLPDYWSEIQRSKRQVIRSVNKGKLFLAFRDFRTAEYFNGWYDEATEELTLHTARGETQVKDFLINYGQPVPEAIPIWSIVFDPQAPAINLTTRTINVFKPSSYMRFAETQAKITPARPFPLIMKLITHVVGEEMARVFVNWLAFCFQYRIAPKTAWIWHGRQGTGKGVLMNHVLAKIFGASNVSMKRMEELEDKFNDHLENRLICYVDEAQIADSGRSKMIMANLKNQITEPTITIRRMRQSAYDTVNHIGWIFASNMPDPVVVDGTDRRFNVGDYQIDQLKITDAELVLVEDELQAFANHLQTLKIDLELVRSPVHTEAKAQMIMVSRSSADTVADSISKGLLNVLWDALPTVDVSLLDMSSAIRLQPYKQLVYELVRSRRTKISREELFIIFNYNVGNTPNSPWKLTSYLKHHGLQIKDIRIGERITKGIHVNQWEDSEEWFVAREGEIEAELKPKLKLISKQDDAAIAAREKP